jgi:adenylate cyclase
MGIEVERKFMVGTLDGVELGPGRRLRQGYLAEEGDVEVRVRIAADEAELTVKAGGGLSRTEVTCPLSADEAEALWAHTSGRQLDKTRHLVPVDGGTAEVDLYSGALEGLTVVEVEFDQADAAARFVPPPWFGEELTGRAEWKNAALARRTSTV